MLTKLIEQFLEVGDAVLEVDEKASTQECKLRLEAAGIEEPGGFVEGRAWRGLGRSERFELNLVKVSRLTSGYCV